MNSPYDFLFALEWGAIGFQGALDAVLAVVGWRRRHSHPHAALCLCFAVGMTAVPLLIRAAALLKWGDEHWQIVGVQSCLDAVFLALGWWLVGYAILAQPDSESGAANQFDFSPATDSSAPGTAP